MNDSTKIANAIRTGALNVNVQELFFKLLIKGVLISLNENIKIRGTKVPHIIMHTGDDRMFIDSKEYDFSIEPNNISNENYFYNMVPRCVVEPAGISFDTAQLTSPYSKGILQLDINNIKELESSEIYTFSGEFRRMPLKMSFELKYLVDSYTDMLELIQYITSNLCFIRTFNINYLGQKILCSYKIPDSFDEEHQIEIDGSINDSREHKLNLSIEVETNIPIFENRTIVSIDNIITKPIANIHVKNTNETA